MNKIPNWVYSTLSIIGDKEELVRFKTFAKSEVNIYNGKNQTNPLDTQKFIPYPKKYLDLDKKPKTKLNTNKLGHKFKVEGDDGYNNGGHIWCCENWGTKWGICRAELLIDENEKGSVILTDESPYEGSRLVYTFETAWSPTYQIVTKMSSLFPKLTFIYFCEEESNAFVFQAEIKNGIIIEEKDLRVEHNYDDEEDDEN